MLSEKVRETSREALEYEHRNQRNAIGFDMKTILLLILALSSFASSAHAGLSIDTTPIVPSEEIHPTLYFSVEDISALRARIAMPPYSDWWTEVVTKSNSYLGQDLSSPALTEDERSKGAKACAFAYVITDDEQYANKAEEALSAMWSHPNSDNRRMLEAAYHLQSYCEAYDWIQPVLESSDDLSIRQRLASEAERFHNDPVMWSPFGYVNNWGVKAASALATVALSISDYSSAPHTPSQWLGMALDRINALLAVLTTDDGLWIEGSHYLTYTSGNLIPFLWHYKNVSGVNLFENLHPLFDFAIKVRSPDGRLPNIEDAYSNIFPHSMVAPAYEDEDASTHMWAHVNSPGFDIVWWTQDIKEVDLIIVHDTAIPVTPPAEGPSFFFPGARVAVLRSDWEEDGFYLYLNGAPDYNNLLAGGVHTHPDPLEFILYAHKALLANDAGYGPDGFNDDNRHWYTSPEAHNIILVDGSAPQNVAIEMEKWITSSSLGFAEMNASYRGAEVSRSTILVGGEYAIVADYVTASESKSYDFILHGRGEMIQNDRQIIWSVTNDDSVAVDLLAYLFPSTTPIEPKSGLACFDWGQEETNQYITSHAEGWDAQFLTILFPKLTGDSLPTVQELPGQDHTAAVANDDLIILQRDTLKITVDNLESDARFIFMRKLNSPWSLWLIEDGTIVTWEDRLFMKSTVRITLAAESPTEYQYTVHVSRNELQSNLYLALPESLWASGAFVDGMDIAFHRLGDGVDLEMNGGGTLNIDLELATKGDVIPDGDINIFDMVRTVHFIIDIGPEGTRHELWAADANYDGEINILDIFEIAYVILSIP